MRIAICPGSFDPITRGHVDIIERAAGLFDKLIVAVMHNSDKHSLFTLEERVDQVSRVLRDHDHIEIDSFGGLLIDYVNQKKACAVVRGLRAVSDFEREFQMALTNKKLNPRYETLFLTTSPEYLYLSSSIVKEIATYHGDITGFVHKEILHDVYDKLGYPHSKR